jgi:hypothetical protein
MTICVDDPLEIGALQFDERTRKGLDYLRNALLKRFGERRGEPRLARSGVNEQP